MLPFLCCLFVLPFYIAFLCCNFLLFFAYLFYILPEPSLPPPWQVYERFSFLYADYRGTSFWAIMYEPVKMWLGLAVAAIAGYQQGEY